MTDQDQLAFDLPHRTALTREDFLVAEPNEDAIAWLDRWPDWPGNALLLYGPRGCGKTHLCAVFQETSGAVSLQLSDFQRVVQELTDGRLEQRHFVVDDVDQIDDPVALFHLYNAVREKRGSLLLTAQNAPAQWGLSLADLRSRLQAISAVAISAPDDSLLGAILVKLFRDRQLRVNVDVVNFLLFRMERSFEDAHAIVDGLDRLSLMRARAVTRSLAAQFLKEREERSESD